MVAEYSKETQRLPILSHKFSNRVGCCPAYTATVTAQDLVQSQIGIVGFDVL